MPCTTEFRNPNSQFCALPFLFQPCVDPIVSGLVPIFFLIAFGYVLKSRGFPGGEFWPAAEKFTYFILFPSLLTRSLATARLSDIELPPLAIALVGSVAAIVILLIILRRFIAADGTSFSSVVQGSIRPNTYVGLACALAIGGPAGLSHAVVALAILIPLVNIISVSVLVHYSGVGNGKDRGLLSTLARNPLIISCMLGLILNLLGIQLPQEALSLLDILGAASLPLGLLAVGAGLDVRAAVAARSRVFVAAAAKLVVLPLLALFLCRVAGGGSSVTQMALLVSALPGSASSYILARQLGGDEKLMAGILTFETIAASISIPTMLLLL